MRLGGSAGSSPPHQLANVTSVPRPPVIWQRAQEFPKLGGILQ
jgi:hypothetical protein